jgi:hypothetical protein
VEYYRFVEENPAVSKVFFRKKVIFRVLAWTAGAGEAHGATGLGVKELIRSPQLDGS